MLERKAWAWPTNSCSLWSAPRVGTSCGLLAAEFELPSDQVTVRLRIRDPALGRDLRALLDLWRRVGGDLVRSQTFAHRRDRPSVPKRIDENAVPFAPEHVFHRHLDLRPGLHRSLGERVHVVH